jgi:hypothetical protein
LSSSGLGTRMPHQIQGPPRATPRRYQLRHCVEACGRAIRALDGVRVSWPAALALLRLPPGLQEAAAFSSLAEVRRSRLSARAWGGESGPRFCGGEKMSLGARRS